MYVEHNILDFYEDKVKKLGNFDFVPENDKNNYNVVVKTPNYFKYKDKYPEVLEKLNHKNTMWKHLTVTRVYRCYTARRDR